MARATLPRALELMFGHEGGYSNAKTDSGGPTKYGVTQKTLAAHRGVSPYWRITEGDVKNLTIAEAEEIYRKGYWTQSGGDLLPVGLDYAAFDFGVNSGPARAIKVLQKLVGAPIDGNAGPTTLAAVEAYGPAEKVIRDYCGARMAFLRSLTNAKTGFPVNGRGWTIRVTGIDPKGLYAPTPGVVGNALAMVAQKPLIATLAAPVGGDAKAVPADPNPWTKPEVLGPVGGVLGGLPAILSVQGPLQYVFAGGVALLFLLGAYYAFKRIARTPA